jgi:Mg-chelatase subunit ChlD
MPPRRRAGSGAAAADAQPPLQEEAPSAAPSRSQTEPGQIAHVHYHGANDWPCALLLLASFAAAALVGHAHEHVHEVAVKAAHPAAPPPAGTHFVFVLDESSSMSGERWSELRAGYSSFVTSRTASVNKAQAAADTTSIVYFAGPGTARLAQDNSPGYGDISAANQGGLTSYSAGLTAALAQLQKTAAGRAAWLIFLSDGEDGDTPSTRMAAVNAVRAWAEARNAATGEAFQVSTIACGKDARSVGTLLDLKDGLGATKGATHHAAPDADQLKKVFSHIGDWSSYDGERARAPHVACTPTRRSPLTLRPLARSPPRLQT